MLVHSLSLFSLSAPREDKVALTEVCDTAGKTATVRVTHPSCEAPALVATLD